MRQPGDSWRAWIKLNPERVRYHKNKWSEKNREIIKLKRRKYIKEHREEINQKNKEYYWSNQEKRIFTQAKKRAKQDGLEFNLELSDIIIPDVCPVTNHKFDKEKKETRDYSPSIDRIDNSKGYIKGNISIISGRANRIKSDATVAEITNLYKYITNSLSS